MLARPSASSGEIANAAADPFYECATFPIDAEDDRQPHRHALEQLRRKYFGELGNVAQKYQACITTRPKCRHTLLGLLIEYNDVAQAPFLTKPAQLRPRRPGADDKERNGRISTQARRGIQHRLQPMGHADGAQIPGHEPVREAQLCAQRARVVDRSHEMFKIHPILDYRDLVGVAPRAVM